MDQKAGFVQQVSHLRKFKNSWKFVAHFNFLLICCSFVAYFNCLLVCSGCYVFINLAKSTFPKSSREAANEYMCSNWTAQSCAWISLIYLQVSMSTCPEKTVKKACGLSSTHRTAFIVRPAILRITLKTSTGFVLREVEDQHTMECSLTQVPKCYSWFKV